MSQKQKVVFIFGIGRSGSTLLDFIIGSHSQCFSLGEISKISEIYQKTEVLGNEFWDQRFTPSEKKRFIAGISNHRIHKFIPLRLERWIREIMKRDQILHSYSQLLSKIDQTILVDSSKYHSWVAQKITSSEFKRGLLDYRLIHVCRDGRSVMNSYLRRYPEIQPREFCYNWVKLKQEREQLYATIPESHKITVRYEELASNPSIIIQSVCDFIGISYEPDMLEYWKHEHHQIAGSVGTKSSIEKYQKGKVGDDANSVHGDYYAKSKLEIKLDLRWRKELSEENRALFESIAGEENRGYEWND
jgi:hypothetical protein